MLSLTMPRGAHLPSRALQLIQWAVLVGLTASLATREWYEHAWLSWLLVTVATAIWAPNLRSGARRWWFFYVAGFFVYTLLRAQADSFLMLPARMDYTIRFDKLVFGGQEPVVWLQSRFFTPPNVGVFDMIATQMHWSFFVVPHALAAAIYIWRRELFSRYVIMLLAIEYIGLLCFYLVPTAPPWLAAQYGEIGPVYRVMNFVGGSLDAETYRTLYTALGEPNSVAAMPSIHMAVTFAGYLWVRRYYPAVAPIFLIYSLLMGISLIHLAEHYVFDLLAGALIAILVDQVIERWMRRSQLAAERISANSRPAAPQQ
jgi:hypothetical protein